MQNQIFEKVKLLDSDLPKVVLAGPLSRQTMFALHITGPYGAEEIKRLITMMGMQLDWFLADDDSKLPTAEDVKGILAVPETT